MTDIRTSVHGGPQRILDHLWLKVNWQLSSIATQIHSMLLCFIVVLQFNDP
jgi:hypothetical protein